MERKWTYLMFAVAGLVLAYLLLKIGDWAWSYLGTKPNEWLINGVAFAIAGGVAWMAVRNERMFELATEVTAELKRLRRENAELKRANEILKAASEFFAAELDRPGPR